MSYEKWNCRKCRYRNRDSFKDPCAAGTYQILYGGCCNEWKPRTWWQRMMDKICAIVR